MAGKSKLVDMQDVPLWDRLGLKRTTFYARRSVGKITRAMLAKKGIEVSDDVAALLSPEVERSPVVVTPSVKGRSHRSRPIDPTVTLTVRIPLSLAERLREHRYRARSAAKDTVATAIDEHLKKAGF